jgi:excisionase family DNA binding protein
MGDDRILVSKREAARLLGISVTSLDYLIRQRELTIRRIGRRTLVSTESLHAYARHDHDRVRELTVVPAPVQE